MKVSAFTFIKNGQILGYPFLQSIHSILPIVDEFIINVGIGGSYLGPMMTNQALKDAGLIINGMNQMHDRGYVYGQQKMIAQFNCQVTGLFILKVMKFIMRKI